MIPYPRNQQNHRSPDRHQRRAGDGDGREAGVILTDLSLIPWAVDSGAKAILSDANRKAGKSSEGWPLPTEITAMFDGGSHDGLHGRRVLFRGERTEYVCTIYKVEPHQEFLNTPLLALCLQRSSASESAILQIAAECHLTAREEEVLKGISVGLTSKEVAQRMEISPNTVKTYLRLIMVKMGVTTRAAIVGKLLNRDR